MSDYLKRTLQKFLIQKRHRLYEERIARQAVPYGVWLEKLLEQEKAEILTWKEEKGEIEKENLSVSVFTEEAFCGIVSDREQWEKQGELWIVTSDPDALVQEAIWEVKRYFKEHPACAIAYGDEDRYLKPDWSPDLLQAFFYFGNIFALRKSLLLEISRKAEDLTDKIREQVESVEESGMDKEELLMKRKLYEVVLCCIDEAKEAGHIEKILFLSGKSGKQPENPAGDGDIPAKYKDWGGEPVFDKIKKGHLYSDVEISDVRKEQELVSVIIPSKDNPAVLSKCIHSLREKTDYQNMEIIVIDNGSNNKNKNRILQIRDQLKEKYSFRYFYKPMDFNFSILCNLGAGEANGKYLLFLNDDIEISEGNWLRIMLSKAAKNYVGAVGAKLLYPDSDKIQHLGVTSIHLGPAHKLQFSSDREEHYHGYNRYAVNVSAVTGACLLVRKAVFEEMGGFSEKLQVAFNDVEFCFHLLKEGYRNVCCNNTFLYHHESLSRGFDAGVDKVARLHRERDLLYAAYPEMWNRDAFYSRKLVTDILDGGFEPASRFEERRLSEKAKPERIADSLNPVWHNECLHMGFEFTGDESAWRTGMSGRGDYYIQGWSYADNVDNSRYERSLLLKPLQSRERQDGCLWKIPYRACYRPDFEENLSHIDHPALCGVSIWVARETLPAGEYLIGGLWEDTCSRQKLYGFSAEILSVFE